MDTKKLFQMFPNQTVTECPFQDPQCSFQTTKAQLAKVPSGRFLAKGGLFYVTNDLRTVSGNSFDLRPFDAMGYQKGAHIHHQCQKSITIWQISFLAILLTAVLECSSHCPLPKDKCRHRGLIDTSSNYENGISAADVFFCYVQRTALSWDLWLHAGTS